MRETLLAVMGGVPGARWQDDAQLHLTLRFIGEVERPLAEDAAAALAQVTHPQPTVAVQGAGAFDRKGSVHTLWAGVAPDDNLRVLQQRINRALGAVGIPPEGRAFHPHVTLARLSRGAGPVEPFLARTAGLATEAATLDAFLLYESRLGSEGAQYEAVARYPLM